MITRFVEIDGDDHGYTGTKMTKRSEYYGMSADSKPTEHVNNADIFYEMDTKKVYLFDEAGQQWLVQN